MAERDLLHQNKLDLFTWWLVSLGYKIQPTKGVSEVLRAKKDKDTVIVFKKQNAKEHLVILQKDYELVKLFIKQQQEIKRAWGKNNEN